MLDESTREMASLESQQEISMKPTTTHTMYAPCFWQGLSMKQTRSRRLSIDGVPARGGRGSASRR